MAKKTPASSPTAPYAPSDSESDPFNFAPPSAPIPPEEGGEPIVGETRSDEEIYNQPHDHTSGFSSALPLTIEDSADEALARASGVSKSVAKTVLLPNLDPEFQAALAREIHEMIGKASGYIPDYDSLTENMKQALLRSVAHVWNAASKKVREFNE